MNPFLWDGYTVVQVNEKIRYWVDLWETLIDELGSPASGLDLSNPHLIVRNIIDEIVFNHFQNPDNKAFFKKKLEFFIENDPATKKLFASDLALVRREFGSSRLAYLLQLARAIDQAYSTSNYLDELYSALRSIFTTPSWQQGEPESIAVISQCLIVELLLKGYSLETIKGFPAKLFDRTTGLHFFHGFPTNINESDYVKDGQLDIVAYRAAVQASVDAASIEERLAFFRTLFSPKPKPVYMIYQIEGLKGDDLDITVGNVNLYSPKKKRYVKTVPGGQDNYRQEELFACSLDACFANAAVHVQDIDTAASERLAVSAIEKALDLFRTFVSSDVAFKVMSHQFIRVSPEGEYWGSGQRGRSRTDPAYKHFRSVDLAELSKYAFANEFLDSAGRILFERAGWDVGQKMAYSLHWYRKAEESETPEDRLLGYWIVLENIVAVEKSDHNVLLPDNKKETKFSLISELVPPIEASLFLANAAGNLYQKLVRLMTSSTNGRPHLTLPEGVTKNAMLNPGSTVNLPTFVERLQEVADAIDRKTIKDSVLAVRRFYTNVQFAKDEISRRVQNVKDDLLLIYRLRNLIVHNAHHEHENVIVPYYVDRIRSYAGNTLRQVLNDVCTGRERSVEQSLMRYHVTLSRIREKLEKNVAVDFWSVYF